MIPDAKIAEIRERADIAEVVGEYVTLRRAGINLKGVCPFHADSDPSFNVNPARQFFHCFGCGASGDVFSFLERIEGVDFIEAARRLARRFGIDIPEPAVSAEARTKETRAREAAAHRRAVLEEAARFFEAMLAAPEGDAARKALAARAVTDETRAKYRLGYAPDSWNGLIEHMRGRNMTPKDLLDVGLVLPRRGGSGYYDRFRHRLMFPVTDPAGAPIAFSGRALGEAGGDQGAKYINSPETADYVKGRVLFGLYQARVALSKLQEAVLVEGNFDVVSLAQAGVENVVAPLGTALTEEQAALLRRRVERVVVMFDGDAAGRKAAARAFPVLAKAGIAGYIAILPKDEDPDSFARGKGSAAVADVLARRRGLLDQIVEDAAAACDGSLQDAARRIEKLRPFLDALKTPMEADLYRQRIAERFNMEPRLVFKFLRRSREAADVVEPPPMDLPGTVEEREMIGLFLDQPELFADALADGTVDLVRTPALRRLLDELAFRHRRKEASISELVSSTEEGEVRRWLASRAMTCLFPEPERAHKAYGEVRGKLAARPRKEEIRSLDREIREASTAGDETRVLELLRKKASLQGAC